VDVPLNYAAEQIPITSAIQRHARYWVNYIWFAPAICVPLTLIFLTGVAAAVDQMLSKSRKDNVKRDDILILFLVASAVFLSILISGAVYQHYWLQIIPLVAIVCSFSLAYMRQRWTPWIPYGLVILCLSSAVIRTFQSTVTVLNSPDQITDRHFIKRTADLLETNLLPYDQVWAVKHHLILWYLDRRPVSWIATHPSNIERSAIIAPLVSAGYLDSGELQRIYESYPKFIVTDEEIVPWYIEDKVQFENYLSSHYQEFYREERVVVFARIDG
jgi:hypothetical protein